MNLLPAMLMVEASFECLEAFDITRSFLDECFRKQRLNPCHIVRRKMNPPEVGSFRVVGQYIKSRLSRVDRVAAIEQLVHRSSPDLVLVVEVSKVNDSSIEAIARA
jgi:hypothetical protein